MDNNRATYIQEHKDYSLVVNLLKDWSSLQKIRGDFESEDFYKLYELFTSVEHIDLDSTADFVSEKGYIEHSTVSPEKYVERNIKDNKNKNVKITNESLRKCSLCVVNAYLTDKNIHSLRKHTDVTKFDSMERQKVSRFYKDIGGTDHHLSEYIKCGHLGKTGWIDTEDSLKINLTNTIRKKSEKYKNREGILKVLLLSYEGTYEEGPNPLNSKWVVDEVRESVFDYVIIINEPWIHFLK